MESEQLCRHIKIPIKSDKNILYKDKKYPINFSIFTNYSNFFYKARNKYEKVTDIELLEISDVSEDAIQNFIKCCQNESFTMNDDNVFILQQLAAQYEVPELVQISNEYIKENNEKLVFQSIYYKYENQKNKENQFFGLETEEEIIASDLFKYINNDQLVDLPVHVLYRILNRSCHNSNQIKSDNRFVDFLFKCLDRYKREASVLFSFIDFEQAEYTILSRLLDNYSSVFDFSMIDSKNLMKTTSLLLSDLNKLKIEFSNRIKDMDKLIENQKEMIEKDKLVTKAREEKFQSILCEIKEEQKKEREEWKDSFGKFKQQTTEQIEKMKLSLNEIVSNEIKKEKLSHFNIFSFNGNNSFNGILNHLRKKERNS